MPAPLVLIRGRLRKPLGPVEVDRAHPLARGLIWCALPDGRHPYELLDRGRASLYPSGSWGGRTRLGAALESASQSNGGAGFPWSLGLDQLTGKNTLTWLIWADPAAGLTGNWQLFNIPFRATGWTNPWGVFAPFRDNTLNNGTMTVLYATSETTRADGRSGAGFLEPTDPLTQYVFTREGASFVFYKDGDQHSTGDSADTTNWQTVNRVGVSLLNRTSDPAAQGEGIIGTCPMAALWSRPLTEAEIRWTHEEPFAFLRAQAERVYVELAPAPAPEPAVVGVFRPVFRPRRR